jgi:hypothetical protein
VASGQTLTVDALFLDADGDIDVYIIDPSGTQQATGSSTTDDENLTYTATATGLHIVRVRLYSDDGATFGNSYTLVLGVQ